MIGNDGHSKVRQLDLSALKIIKYPDPRLREKSTEFQSIEEELKGFVEAMSDLMFKANGVGLAAPQVGVTARLFIVCTDLDNRSLSVFINPEILSEEGTQEEEEGCLSIPNVSARIKRPNVVTVRATNLAGEVFEATGRGLLARAFRHEMDHLDGTLFIDRMGTVAKLANRRALRDLEEQFA